MMEVEVGNVAEAIANLTELGASEPVVKATITLSESGFISVSDAIAFGDIKDDTITGEWSRFPSTMFAQVYRLFLVGKLKGFFGGGSTSSSDETTESAENVPPRNSETASTSSADPSSSGTSSGNGNASASATPEKKKAIPVENTIPLTANVKFTSIPPLTVSEKKTSRNRFVYNLNY